MRVVVNVTEQFMEIELSSEHDLPSEGKGRCIKLPNGKEIALFCAEGEYYAISNTCSHEGGPLCEGDVEGTVVTCPWHGWQFDVQNGKCQNLIGEDVEHYDIEKRGNTYWIIINKQPPR